MADLFTLTMTVSGTPTTYGVSARAANRIKLDRLALSLDDFGSLEFHEYAKTLPATWKEGAIVELDYSGAPVFKGEVVQIQPQFGATGWTIGYQCQGLKYVGNKIAVTNSFDGTGSIIYNLPSDDQDYVSANSGLSVGTILSNVFTAHATQLAAVGIAGFVAGDLTALTLVPTDTISFQGPSLFNATDQFLNQWAGNYSSWIEYESGTADWRIRVKDSTAFTPSTLTFGTDPIDPASSSISRDSSGSYSQVIVRGKANIEPLSGSLVDGTLTKAWTTTQQNTWTWNDWVNPGGASDYGTISAVGSTTVTVASHDALVYWATNFWSTNQGGVWLINPASTSITQQEYRRITACTALTAGGTSVLTLDRPLVNGGYTIYRATCDPVDTLVDVYRRYNVVSTIAFNHLVHKFNVPVKWMNNGVVIQTLYPAAAIIGPLGQQFPATFVIDSVNNQIVFTEPVVKILNAQSVLDAGGSAVAAPADVLALVPYSRGTLTATAPSSGYSGTLFSFAGIQRTWYTDEQQWINAADQSLYDALATLRHDTVKDTVIDGTIEYRGLYAAALTLGLALNITGNTYTTGWEAINAPVRNVVVNWPPSGESNFITTMHCNSRRKPATGESYYIHPAFTGGDAAETSGPSMNLSGGGAYQTPGFGSGGTSPFAAGQSTSPFGSDATPFGSPGLMPGTDMAPFGAGGGGMGGDMGGGMGGDFGGYDMAGGGVPAGGLPGDKPSSGGGLAAAPAAVDELKGMNNDDFVNTVLDSTDGPGDESAIAPEDRSDNGE